MNPEVTDDYVENVRQSPEYFRRSLIGSVEPGPLAETTEQTLVTGSGSSYSMALLASDLLRRLGRPARAVYPYELTRYEQLNGEVVVCISQSGETTDILNAVDKACAAGCRTVGITAVEDSTLGKQVDQCLTFEPKGEYILSRSCGVSSCLGLLFCLYQKLGAKSPKGWPSEAIERFASRIEHPTNSESRIRDVDEYVILAGGSLRPIAVETALSVQETAFINATGRDIKNFAHGRAFRHGSSENTAFVLLEAQDDDSEVFDAAESMLSSLGHETIRVTSAFAQPWAATDTLAWSLALTAQLNKATGLNLADPPNLESVRVLLDHPTEPND